MRQDEWTGDDVTAGHLRSGVMSGAGWATSGGAGNPVLTPRPRTRAGDAPRVGVERHREAVVRRLLERGLSPTAVIALLPDFRDLVERIVEQGGEG